MKILIVSNKHVHYGRVGEIVGRTGQTYSVRIPHRTGSILTLVRDNQFKPIKRQESE